MALQRCTPRSARAHGTCRSLSRGATVAEGHYELYSDNILDLSHANFVHPALVASAFTEGERKFWQDGNSVFAEYVRLNDHLSVGIAAVMGTEDEVGRASISTQPQEHLPRRDGSSPH